MCVYCSDLQDDVIICATYGTRFRIPQYVFFVAIANLVDQVAHLNRGFLVCDVLATVGFESCRLFCHRKCWIGALQERD